MPNRPSDDEPQPLFSLDDESADATPERGADEPERGLGDLAQRSDGDDSDALDLGILEPRPADDDSDDDDGSAAADASSFDATDDEDDDVVSAAGDDGTIDSDDDADGGAPEPPSSGDTDGHDSESPDSIDSDSDDDSADESDESDESDDDDDDDKSVGPSDEIDTTESDDDDGSADDFEDDGSSPLVKAGPRWYRSQIRRFGPVAALAPMAAFGLIAWLALTFSDSRASGIVGLVAGATAAPGLLVAGAPFGDSDYYPFVVMASIPFWLLLGWLAARRATRQPVMSWRDYARELAWLAIAALVGVIVALSIASSQLGEPLLS